MTMTIDRPKVADAEEAVREKSAEIAGVEAELSALRQDRAREAAAGRDTRGLRQQIADGEGDLDDLRIQHDSLSAALTGAREVNVARERHAALALIYRTDLEVLRARRRAMVKRAALAAENLAFACLLDEIGERTGRMPGSEVGYARLREPTRAQVELGVECDPKAAAPLIPLGGTRSDGGDTVEELDADIKRIELLAVEAESNEATGGCND